MISYSFNKKLVIIIFCILIIIWNYVSGKDISWDFLNYHLYSSYLMIENRWDKDFFAASIQSYLNPISYIPIYFMVMSGVPDVLMAAALIIPAIVSVFLLWHLCEKIIPYPEKNINVIFLMVSLALTTSLWLIVIGSTFNDSLACAITISSLIILLQNPKQPLILIAASGILMGISTGIKLTNGSYTFAILITCFFIQRKKDFKIILISIFILCTSIFIGFLIAHGYWSWKLWSEFKNPFFPFFNGIFKSPNFLFENLQDRRFMVESWKGIFTLPFKMPMIQPWIYNETSAPEIKIAIVFLLVPIILILSFTQKNSENFRKKISNNFQHNENLMAVTIFIIVSYVIWSTSSRIGRYGIFIWVSSGIIIPAWILLIFGKSIAHVTGLLLIVIQCFLNFNAGIARWSPTSWGGTWFRPEIPKILIETPHTIITTAIQTFSAIAPFTHPDNKWSNVIGQYTLPSGENISTKLKSNLKNSEIIAIIPSLYESKEIYKGPDKNEKKIISSLFMTYGLLPKNFDCAPIKIKQNVNKIITLHACPMKFADLRKINDRQNEIKKYDAIFDTIEDRCPLLFSPKRSYSFSVEDEFVRFYFNTSIRLYSEKNKIFTKMPRQINNQVIALVDNNSGEIISEVKCPELPKKLYLD